ncbi:MAG: four helix bundle protein [bacterium]|nr:four helix bundle protein [bacterium]
MLNSYKDLIVWQKSIDLVVEIYALTEAFPKTEIYGLTNQMRRAVVSIPSNIAEGYSRKHRPEYMQFIKIAFGSSAELETQLIIGKKLKFVSEERLKKSDELLSEVMKMLNKLSSSLSLP